uniref:EGF-like domain-containing protein n=1 Tax=Neogobius melanostomus TaxID=47308 RepID=A0A8C6V6N7_9GOBI
ITTNMLFFLPLALLPMLAVLLVFFTTELTALSTESTAAPVVSNSSLSVNNGSLSGPTGMKSHRPCGNETDPYCLNGGQCVYYQDQVEPACMCEAPFEGPRCTTINAYKSGYSDESQSFLIIFVTVSLNIMMKLYYHKMLNECVCFLQVCKVNQNPSMTCLFRMMDNTILLE